ncbi:MAG: hypothetical protein ACLR8P_07380 [Clostridium fessum]
MRHSAAGACAGWIRRHLQMCMSRKKPEEMQETIFEEKDEAAA